MPSGRQAAGALLARLRLLASGSRGLATCSGTTVASQGRLAACEQAEAAAARQGLAKPASVQRRGVRIQSSRWTQTATAAAQTLSQPSPSFAPVPPSPLRPLHVSKERLSLKGQVIFEASWKKIEEKYKERLVCPREVVWLNGAPGSGKGTNMPFIMKSRGLSRAIGMSQLLDTSKDIKSIIDRGELVPDHMVLDALLEVVLNPESNDGAGLVIDGFPRTALQVDFVKLLHDKLMSLSLQRADTPEEWRFPRPSFKVVILYVDEEESVRRQMRRAQLAAMHNKRVMDAGTGDVWDVRTTDVNEALCRRRYQVFKAHYHTILRLKSFFPFSLIDAMGTLDEARQQIMRELRYQSSLDLDEATYSAIRHLPLARDLVRVARQRLVFRLDAYCKRDNKLFSDVIKLIDAEVIPVLKQSSLAGSAEYRTQSPLLRAQPHAVDILIDVLSDRGFSVAHTLEERLVPERIDLATGEIACRPDPIHIFRITFDKENVRDLSTPTSVTTKQGEDVAIGTTFIPQHMIREESKRVSEAMQWSPVPASKTHKVQGPAGAVPEPNGSSGSSSSSGGGSAHAAPTSRSAAPTGLAVQAKSLDAAQQQQQQVVQVAAAAGAQAGAVAGAHAAAAAVAGGGGAPEGYNTAAAVAGSAKREAAQVTKDDLEVEFVRKFNSSPAAQIAAEQAEAARRQQQSLWLDQYASLDALNERED